MFEKPQTLRLAAYMGMLASLTYLLLGLSATASIRTINPFGALSWETQIQVAAARFPEQFVVGGILVVVHLFAAIFFLALANRAARMHPTSAIIGGGLLIGAVATSAFHRIWEVFGADLLAVRYVSVENADLKTPLMQAFQLSSAVDGVILATAITLSIPGFLALSYALRELPGIEKLPATGFLLAAVTQFLAVLAIGYAFNLGRLEHRFDRILVAISTLGAWVVPVLATGIAAYWLLKQAQATRAPAARDIRPPTAAAA